MQPVDFPPFRAGSGSSASMTSMASNTMRAPHFPWPGPQHRQHAAEIEISRLDQIGLRLGVQEKQFFSPQLREVPAKAFGIGDDALRASSKATKMPGSSQCCRAMHQKLQRKYGLAGARSAQSTWQRGAATWQTSAGDFVEAQ
jgi:hypothetical protein